MDLFPIVYIWSNLFMSRGHLQDRPQGVILRWQLHKAFLLHDLQLQNLTHPIHHLQSRGRDPQPLSFPQRLTNNIFKLDVVSLKRGQRAALNSIGDNPPSQYPAAYSA